MTEQEINKIDEALETLIGADKLAAYKDHILRSSFNGVSSFISDQNGKPAILVYPEWNDDIDYRITLEDLIKNEIADNSDDEEHMLLIVSALEDAIKNIRESL